MPPKVQAAKVATFDTDDKRAQYARLAVFNHGVQEKIISKDKDVNTVSVTDLQKAFKSIVGGTLLAGKEGIGYLQELTKKGATDENVAKRGLTLAYAQEVRPFIMRGLLSADFGRRGKKAAPKAAGNGGEKKTPTVGKAKPATKKAGGRKGSAKRSTSKATPVVTAGESEGSESAQA